jgi:hypothetical protein
MGQTTRVASSCATGQDTRVNYVLAEPATADTLLEIMDDGDPTASIGVTEVPFAIRVRPSCGHEL